MSLLIAYVLLALVFSFLCSVAEAVILSVTPAYIAFRRKEHPASAELLHQLKGDIQTPLAAILTLNTVAHTVGAAGAGAQAAVVFGSTYLGIASAVLTLLILVFSEIIPKTLGALYWRALAPLTAYGLKYLVFVLYPFVKLSELITNLISDKEKTKSFLRGEFAAIADIGQAEGELDERERTVLKNLLLLPELRIRDAMTPRTVVFAVPQTLSVNEYFRQYEAVQFSRIPVYKGDGDSVSGFVMRNDLLLAQARGGADRTLESYRRGIPVLLDSMKLSHSFDEFQRYQAHIALVVDEYGGMAGIITMEDFLETLLGEEIVDEFDQNRNMQALARQLWKRRAGERGIKIEQDDGATPES
jgi:CBS domain containing-hemolysin-like protein